MSPTLPLLALLFATTLLAGPAAAQDVDFVDTKEVASAIDAKKAGDGWDFSLKLAATMALSQSDRVVGQTDGATLQFGGTLKGGADWRSGRHEWSNQLTLTHAQTRTPQFDEFLKTADNLEVRSMYLYGLESVPWLGPFARFRLGTSIMPGFIMFDAPTVINAAKADGTTTPDQDIPEQERVHLTDAFEPLLLRESAGVFARPVDRPAVKLTSTLGLGAQQLLTNEGFVLADDADTENVVEFKQLEDVQQIGVEFEVDLSGKLNERVTWAVNGNVLYPFYTDPDPGLSGLDVLNTEVSANLSMQMSSWVSLDYVLSAKRLPLIVDEWQVQNGLLLALVASVL